VTLTELVDPFIYTSAFYRWPTRTVHIPSAMILHSGYKYVKCQIQFCIDDTFN